MAELASVPVIARASSKEGIVSIIGPTPSEINRGLATANRIPSLDGIRALSIGLILTNHVGVDVYYDGSTRFGAALYSFGDAGVRIFFVLSGYLITLLLIQETERRGQVKLSQFYIRRIFRILPAAYTFIVVSLIVFAHSITTTNAVLAVLFLENYSLHTQARELGHLWSLGVEEQFYLLWPALFVFAPRFRKFGLLATLCAVPLINLAMIHYNWPFWGFAFYSVADALACGCLLALLRGNKVIGVLLDNRWFFLIPVFALIVTPMTASKGGHLLGSLKPLVLLPGLNVAIALCIEKAIRSAPAILNARWITTIGVMSYSIYLWQQPLSRMPINSPSKYLDLLVRLAAIGACAAASFYLVEQPFLRLRRRFFAA